MLKKLFLVGLAASMVACVAPQEDDDFDVDDEDNGVGASALATSPGNAIQLLNSNTKHLSQPGKRSFNGHDFRELLYFARTQKYLPDIMTLQEVGNDGKAPSQTCADFTKQAKKILSPKSKIDWNCVVAQGSLNKENENARGGVAIVYRKSIKVLGKKTVNLFVYDKGKCVLDTEARGWQALVVKFQDAGRTLAVASVHLPADSGGNAGDDCAKENLIRINAAIESSGADVKVIAGDMNHLDATRTAEGASYAHQRWEKGYETINADLEKISKKKSLGYRDAWFRQCGAPCGTPISSSTAYTAEQNACISACIAQNHGGAGRIDWVMVKGGNVNQVDPITVPYEAARAAAVAATGNTNLPERYSDHKAHMLTLTF